MKTFNDVTLDDMNVAGEQLNVNVADAEITANMQRLGERLNRAAIGTAQMGNSFLPSALYAYLHLGYQIGVNHAKENGQ